MGQLDIGRGGSAFILPRNCSYVHAYSNNTYYQSCQELLYNSHAYMFSSFSETRPRNFNNLRLSKGQNVPTAVERRLNDQNIKIDSGPGGLTSLLGH